MTHDRLRRRRTDLLREGALAAELRLGMDLDQTVGTHEIDLAAFAKAEVVDQLRQLFHAQAQPGDTDHFAGLLDLQVDEQRQFSSGAIVVDVQGARLVAVEEGIEPGIGWFGPAERAIQAFSVM